MVWRTHLIVVGVVALLHIGCQSNPASSSLLPDTGTTEDAAAATDTPAPELDSGHMDVSNDTVGDAENQQLDPSLFVRGSMNLNVHWDIREDSGAVWVEGGDIVVQALSDFPESSTVDLHRSKWRFGVVSYWRGRGVCGVEFVDPRRRGQTSIGNVVLRTAITSW
ncbi:MAG: hypothetical protein R3E66_23845 [bacterium]